MSYSGKFVLRIPPELHEALVRRARLENISLNQITLQLIRQALQPVTMEKPYLAAVRKIISPLRNKFRGDLLALLVFGSRPKGEATASSDIDLLIVLHDRLPIKRDLYRWWGKNIEPALKDPVNPHFVHLPRHSDKAGGIWFEVALEHDMVYQNGRNVQRFLDRLLAHIQSGKAKREWKHGHPYWVRASDEK